MWLRQITSGNCRGPRASELHANLPLICVFNALYWDGITSRASKVITFSQHPALKRIVVHISYVFIFIIISHHVTIFAYFIVTELKQTSNFSSKPPALFACENADHHLLGGSGTRGILKATFIDALNLFTSVCKPPIHQKSPTSARIHFGVCYEFFAVFAFRWRTFFMRDASSNPVPAMMSTKSQNTTYHGFVDALCAMAEWAVNSFGVFLTLQIWNRTTTTPWFSIVSRSRTCWKQSQRHLSSGPPQN